jgi:hypothetical protein
MSRLARTWILCLLVGSALAALASVIAEVWL